MHRLFLAATAFALVSVFTLVGITNAQTPQFTMGFQSFASLVPNVVGQPLEDAAFDIVGNATQATTSGLLVWHKLDNVVDFSNGSQTWVLADAGLMLRDNGERFQFEILREQVESQVQSQLDPATMSQAQMDALIAGAQAQLDTLEAQLGQPEALIETQLATFRVTLQNGTAGQPFSPPVAVTHVPGLSIFQVGALASDQIAAVARNGDPVPLFQLLSGAPGVTEAMNLGVGVDPGTAISFMIVAGPDDLFSLATMLGCTNDGFTGVSNVALPQNGTVTFALMSWDAGRENNTERIEDLPGRCGIPVGDPLNRNAEVNTIPPQGIAPHPGIVGPGGSSQLDPATRDWTDPVGMLTIERMTP